MYVLSVPNVLNAYYFECSVKKMGVSGGAVGLGIEPQNGLIPSWAPGKFSGDLILLSSLTSPGVHLVSNRNEFARNFFR
jgi:hypothetical protein